MNIEYKVFIAMSLDGYIAGPDNELDWLTRINNPDEDYGYDAFLNTIDVILMGNNTYTVVSKFSEWPYKKPVIVFSSKNTPSSNVTHFNGNLNDLDTFMENANYKRIYVDGGITISRMLEAKKISSVIITIIPVILGNGIRLFSNFDKDIKLQLLESKTFSSGLMQVKYKPIYQ